MNSIIGIVVTMVCVFGGYMLAGGKLGIILHALPFEMMMIGGAAIGAFFCGNDLHTVKSTLKDLGAAFKGPQWKRQDYADLLCLMHELISLMEDSPVEMEGHIEDPENSALFQKYPKILSSHDFVELICDTMRSMLMNFDNVYQVEELLDKQLETMNEEALHGSHALQNMADALPALGIVAAVLGVIKTMASINKPPEVLGEMIGGALVGTFLGVFLAYGFVGPLANRVKQVREQEAYFYGLMREVLVSNLHKNEATICIEVARRSAPHGFRPSFSEVEDAIKALKQAA
jgi:chemotaxis protein MotA